MLEDLLVPALRKFSGGADADDGGALGTRSSSFSSFRSDMIYYQPTHGTPSLRSAASSYLSRILNLPSSHPDAADLDEEGLVVGAGCNAVLENLCLCLADAGDAVLIPTPYYAAFEFDLAARAGLNVVPVQTMETSGAEVDLSATGDGTAIPREAYYPTAQALDDAYDRSVAQGSGVPRILLLSHPNNPLGVCYPPEVMKECIDWGRERCIHVVSDEIYAGSVFRDGKTGDDGPFVSALTLAKGHVEHDNGAPGLGLGPYVHLVYALSKDFGLSGLRVGVAYSENLDIRLPFQKLNDLCQVSSQTQLLTERMLSGGGGAEGVGGGVKIGPRMCFCRKTTGG